MNWQHCERTLRLLEFDRIRERAASRALGAEAARLIREEPPLFDMEAVRARKALVASFRCLLENAGGEDRRELPDIGGVLPRLAVEGSLLDSGEVLALGLFLERGEELRRFVTRDESPAPDEGGLRDIAASAPDCSSCAADIFRVIDHEGKVRDLPEIKKIRSRIRELARDLENRVSRYGADDNTRRMLQSVLPSQRDGRVVLAVKANFRGRIKGIVHEVSSTGQTVFVEPEESVEANNQILVEQANLDAEIRRLLRDLTKSLGRRRNELEQFHSVLVYLESLRARARYSLEIRGCFAEEPGPRFGTGLFLKQARHPLLGNGVVDNGVADNGVVPVDLRIDARTRQVVITGPNTGGKTVTLKTIGLFALMNQAGLALPAEEAVLPLFDGVYADIGDEQSISQSLSTFSGHMTNIASIIGEAAERSLVLLDELGSGTDPEEGSAIAMAILDHFIEKKSMVLLTTHHGMLKNYGYSRGGVENASLEFDGRTLSPTYRIIMGIPGESRAVDIAARNGLPPELTEKARTYLDKERSDVSALISGLKEKHRELDEAARSAREQELKLREDRRRADLQELSLRQREYQLKREGALEFRRFLRESRRQLENLVREIREGELTGEKTRGVKEFIRRLEENSAEAEAALEAEEAALAALADPDRGSGGHFPGDADPPPDIAPGVEVTAGPSRRRGRVIRREKKDLWIVETGSVRMSFPERELVPVRASGGKSGETLSAGGAFSVSGWTADLAPAEVKLELNLLGLRLEEALDLLRRQIDGAALAGLREFAVVHGRGDGILQRGVQDYLKNDPAVEEYRFSRPEQGGFGRTEVTLKG
ncbi:MAG: Smr/MutS family protein [Treponema sp.]|jgi:DNA mismatch repair protein MutS2|nr:Smr/MutS family protein [Treponema sp.]